MRRSAIVLLVIAACSAPSKPVTPPTPVPPDAARPPTAAELALEAHRERLLDQRGVVDVRVEGDGLIVDLCAAEVPVDLTGIEVPVTPLAGDWRQTSRGQPCGCGDGGAYLDDGARISRECNTCTCAAGRVEACTELDCRIELLHRVAFTRNNAELSKAAKASLDAIAQMLIANPDVKVTLRGHADANEVSLKKLSTKRAKAVRDYLVKAGAPKAQLLGAEGVGADQPLGSGAEADRHVEFVVAP